MAEIAEVRRLPARVINGEEFPSIIVLPASPLEYFSPLLAEWVCDRWREIDDPLFASGIYTWLLGVRSAISAVNGDRGFEDDTSRWSRHAVDDLDTLVLLAYARRWQQSA